MDGPRITMGFDFDHDGTDDVYFTRRLSEEEMESVGLVMAFCFGIAVLAGIFYGLAYLSVQAWEYWGITAALNSLSAITWLIVGLASFVVIASLINLAKTKSVVAAFMVCAILTLTILSVISIYYLCILIPMISMDVWVIWIAGGTLLVTLRWLLRQPRSKVKAQDALSQGLKINCPHCGRLFRFVGDKDSLPDKILCTRCKKSFAIEQEPVAS